MPPHGPPGHSPATPPEVPISPVRRDDADLPKQSLPHTTAEKAALCDGLLPFLSGLREALWAVAAKRPDAAPGPEAIDMGKILLADVRRLLRGERMHHYVASITIGDAPADRLGLAVKLGLMETAVIAFRKRYFGWHPGFKREAWYLCGESAVDDARRLLPRSTTPVGEVEPQREVHMVELRRKLAERIAQLKLGPAYTAAPLPLHRAGAPETPKEVVLADWPGVPEIIPTGGQ
jgi:hypothetical protein